MDCILETKQLTKEFKGFVAVDKVDLRVKRGTIHALIGPNGAGSPIENEANALAGQIMRRFDQENPELFALGAVTP